MASFFLIEGWWLVVVLQLLLVLWGEGDEAYYEVFREFAGGGLCFVFCLIVGDLVG